MIAKLQQLVRHARMKEKAGDVIGLSATGVAFLGDLAEVESTDGGMSLARVIGLDRNRANLHLFAGGKGLATDPHVRAGGPTINPLLREPLQRQPIKPRL